jgi:hypothetical protein
MIDVRQRLQLPSGTLRPVSQALAGTEITLAAKRAAE